MKEERKIKHERKGTSLWATIIYWYDWQVLREILIFVGAVLIAFFLIYTHL